MSQLFCRPCELGRSHRGGAESSDDESGRDIRQPRCVEQSCSARESQGKDGDHRIAGARDVRDFARGGRER
jgi:hypothetical protein